MSVLRTEGVVIQQPTGIPMPSGLLLLCEDGRFLTTAPVGEAPGGLNSTPGTDPNANNIRNLGANTAPPGVPYGFSAPVVIGPTS